MEQTFIKIGKKETRCYEDFVDAVRDGFLTGDGKQFDPDLSEKENMLRSGFRIVKDAGNHVFKFANK